MQSLTALVTERDNMPRVSQSSFADQKTSCDKRSKMPPRCAGDDVVLVGCGGRHGRRWRRQSADERTSAATGKEVESAALDPPWHGCARNVPRRMVSVSGYLRISAEQMRRTWFKSMGLMVGLFRSEFLFSMSGSRRTWKRGLRPILRWRKY